MDIRLISPDDTIALRHTVLWPNAPLAHVRLPEDDEGFHFGAFLDEESAPTAVISLFKENVPSPEENSGADESTIRIRKLACDNSYQGRGIGTALLEHSIQYAWSKLDARFVWCDARVTALDWYSKRGLVPFGAEFWKDEVKYVRMKIER